MHSSGVESRVRNFLSIDLFEDDFKFEETLKEFFLRLDVDKTLFQLFSLLVKSGIIFFKRCQRGNPSDKRCQRGNTSDKRCQRDNPPDKRCQRGNPSDKRYQRGNPISNSISNSAFL